MASPDALTSATHALAIAALADTNLITHASSPGTPARRIRCGTAGTLVVTFASGASVALDFAPGESQDVQAKAIVNSGSSAASTLTRNGSTSPNRARTAGPS